MGKTSSQEAAPVAPARRHHSQLTRRPRVARMRKGKEENNLEIIYHVLESPGTDVLFFERPKHLLKAASSGRESKCVGYKVGVGEES